LSCPLPARRIFEPRLAAALLAAFLHASSAVQAEPPREGECPAVNAGAGADPQAQDSAALVLEPGMIVDKQGMLLLKSLLPEEIWRHREVFFFEGMQMEIGPCHRRYARPGFYIEATRKHSGGVGLNGDDDLEGYVAGIPFPQGQIDPDDPQAAAKWAWNLEKRFRGAGHRGRFRITTIPNRAGGIHRFRGEFFVFQVRGRSDMASTGYRWEPGKDALWAVGGEFSHPFSARGLAWRQFRVEKSQRKWREPDDVFVYVPSLRKMRRAGSPWVDGAFMPRYSVAGQTSSGGGIMIGDGGGAISPAAGASTAVSEDARAGLTGLFLRPNGYRWRLRGETTVIAPLNAARDGYPIDPERNYGYSGLSVAHDTWDIRQAVVIEGALRQNAETLRTLTIYVDYQTLQPLYWISRTSKRRLVEVGILVHRYTSDRDPAPHWPGGTPAYIFEPVAASFFDALAGRGGWLRESFELSSLPYDDSERRRMITNHALQRGH